MEHPAKENSVYITADQLLITDDLLQLDISALDQDPRYFSCCLLAPSTGEYNSIDYVRYYLVS